MKAKILEIIKRAEAKHPDDPSISNEMDELTELMIQNMHDTIKLFKELDLENLLWLSSDFEELSYKFQSKEFIECLKWLEKKYPKKMSSEIQNAIEAMD